MEDQALRHRLGEMLDALSAIPEGHRASRATGAYVPAPPASQSVDELLDHLRLQTKYILFDLEATRRENRYLREMLERRSNFGDGSDTA